MISLGLFWQGTIYVELPPNVIGTIRLEPTQKIVSFAMADGRVFNYSEDRLVVYHLGASGLVGNVLGDGEMTPDGVVADSVIHVDFEDHAIRCHQYGWKVEPSFQTYVYRNSGPFLFGPVEHDLHCIPSDLARLEPGYSKISRQDRQGISINLSAGWGIAAPPRGSLDGFNELEWRNLFRLFESKKASFIRSGLHLTVRIQLLPFEGIKDEEKTHVRTSLKDGLANYWNRAVNPSGTSSPLRFHAELVEEFADAKIQIRRKQSGSTQNEPNNKDEWWTDIGPQSAAHEYGHLFGLIDEYYIYERKADHNKDVKTPAQMRDAEKRDYPGRNKKRAGAGECPSGHPRNLMEDPFSSAPNPVDQKLIDSVYTANNVQAPCFRL